MVRCTMRIVRGSPSAVKRGMVVNRALHQAWGGRRLGAARELLPQQALADMEAPSAPTPTTTPNPTSRCGAGRMAGAWRYPGVTKSRSVITKQIAREAYLRRVALREQQV